MKKLITTDLGGFPFVLNDIRWMENGLTEVVNSLVSPYLPYSDVPGVLKISGLERTVTSGQAAIAPGYVYIQDEIFACPGLSSHNIVSGNVYRLRILNNFDPSGHKIFQSGTPYDTYAVRTAELIYEPAAPVTPNTFIMPEKSIMSVTYDRMQAKLEAPTLILDQSGLGHSLKLWGRLDFSKSVHLSGSAFIFIYPNYFGVIDNPLFRPSKDITVVLPVLGFFSDSVYTPALGTCVVRIQPDGICFALKHTLSGTGSNPVLEISFDSVSYR